MNDEDYQTTVQIRNSTRQLLKHHMRKDQTYDDKIRELLGDVKDV